MPGHIILTKFKIMPQLLRSDLMKLVSMRMILGLCRKTLKNNFLVFCEQFLSTNRSKSLDFCILGKILCKCDVQSRMCIIFCFSGVSFADFSPNFAHFYDFCLIGKKAH